MMNDTIYPRRGFFLQGLRHRGRWIALCIAAWWICCLPTARGQECPPVGLPIAEDFEGNGELPTCWERWENFDYAALKAHIVSSPTYHGNGALMMSAGNTAEALHETMVMMRTLQQSPTGVRLRMKIRANVAGAKVIAGVAQSTANLYNEFGFVGVDTLTVATANSWTEVEVDFSSYSGNGDRPALRMIQGMQPGASTMVYIDDMSLQRCWVEGLWVSHRSDHELTLHWSSVGEGTADLTATPAGGGETLTFNGVSSPYRITGLAANTQYTLRLTPQCTGEAIAGTEQSLAAATIGGSHNGLAYCEGFEGSALPAGWVGQGDATTVATQSRSGGRSLYLPAGSHWAVMPTMADGAGNSAAVSELMLNLYLYATSANLRLQVAATDYPLEESEFTPIDTLTVGVAQMWTPQLTRLHYNGTKRFLVLRTLPSATSGAVYVDDLRVGRCLLTGVTLGEYTSTTARLEWDAPLWSGQVTIEPTEGGGASIGVTAGDSVENGRQHYTLQNLAPGSSHRYLVYGACDADHCGSAEVSVTTYAQEYALPYCLDFEAPGTLPSDWQNVSSHGSLPQVQNGTSHSGSRALHLSAAGGLAAAHSLTLKPPIAVEGGGVVVSFAVYNTYSGGTLQVGTLEMPAWESNFTPVATLTPTTGEWTRVSVRLGAFTGDGERIALRYYHNGYGQQNLWIDDLTVDRNGVSGVSVYGERSDGATLAWTSTGGTVDVQYRKGSAGTLTTVSNAASPLGIADLDEGSTYHYYLRSTTGDTEGCWTYGGSFTTNSGALRADYCHPTSITVSYGGTPWSLSYLEEESFSGLRVSFDAVGSGTVQVGLMTDAATTTTFSPLGQSAGGSAGPGRRPRRTTASA